MSSRTSGPHIRPARVRYSPVENPPTPIPLVLQHRAAAAVQKHFVRSLARFSALLISDVVTLLLARAAIRWIASTEFFGFLVGSGSPLLLGGSGSALQVVVAVSVGLAVLGTYGAGDRRRNPRAIVMGVSLGLALIHWSTFWSRSLTAVLAYVLSTVLLAFSLIAARAIVDFFVRRYRPMGNQAPRTVVLASSDASRRALSLAPLTDASEFNVLGFVDTNPMPSRDALGGIPDLVRVISLRGVDTLVISGPIDEDLLLELLRVSDAAGCQLLALPSAFGRYGFDPEIVSRSGISMLQLTRPSLRGWQLLLKRLFDVFASGVGLVLISPVLVLIALAIRIDSRGPILFRQVRVGRGGKRFQIYKFRSMIVDAERRRDSFAAQSIYQDNRLFKVRSDPRVTRVGKWLRRTSLDELPQLINVLTGEMSLVGPRPPLPSEVELYEEHHYSRFDMKPGMTGPWQTSGRNQITNFEDVIALESAYMSHWTIWKDFAILLKTVPVVLRMEGAH